MIVPPEMSIASIMADAHEGPRPEIDLNTEWDRVLNILIANKVPLFNLNNAPESLLSHPRYIEEVAKEEATAGTLRSEYALVRASLLAEGVESVLFKSVGLAPSFPHTSDNLDTLVPPECAEVARKTLNALGYVELRNVEEPDKFLFRKYRGAASVSAIHLHTLVGWGVPFLDDDALWSRCQQSVDDPLVIVPSAEDGLLITLAHAFYENKSFKLLDIVRIRHCLRKEKFDYGYLERITNERGWHDGLAFALLLYNFLEENLYSSNSLPGAVRERMHKTVWANLWMRKRFQKIIERPGIDFPFRIPFLLGKIFYYKKIAHDRRRAVRTKFWDVIRTLAWGVKLKLRIRGQKGMLVSFSGIDGSGKSLHARALIGALKTSDIDARYHWARLGSSGSSNRSNSSGTVRDSTPPIEIDTASSLARRRRRLRTRFLRIGWLGLNISKFVVDCFLHIVIPLLRRKVVVCDRYITDAVVEIAASLPEGDSWHKVANWILSALLPKPDLTWLLDVEAEAVVIRQRDESGSHSNLKELELQRALYAKLVEKHNLRVLATRANPGETTTYVVRETLRQYYDDYYTLINAMLFSNPRQMNK